MAQHTAPVESLYELIKHRDSKSKFDTFQPPTTRENKNTHTHTPHMSMLPLTRNQILLGSGLLVSTALIGSRNFWWSPRTVIEPPESTKQGNRIFLPVRFDHEVDPLLLIKRPLLLNFTVRGDPYCNKVTGALQRIVAYETDKRINMVDIEADFPETRDLVPRFGVRSIPTIVAVRKTFPVDYYVDRKLMDDPEGEPDWLKLKEFIEKNSDPEDS